MFYKMTQHVMKWLRWLNPPQGVEMPPLPAVELVEFKNAQTGQVEVRLVERDGNTVRITKVEGVEM